MRISHLNAFATHVLAVVTGLVLGTQLISSLEGYSINKFLPTQQRWHALIRYKAVRTGLINANDTVVNSTATVDAKDSCINACSSAGINKTLAHREGPYESSETQQPVLSGGVVWGLNNQRRGLVYGIMLAQELEMAFLPSGWQLGSNDPLGTIVPFDYFYDRQHLQAAAAAQNITLVTQLPAEKSFACLVQLQDVINTDWVGKKNARKAIKGWKEKHGVVCLPGQATFYAYALDDKRYDTWRHALKPSTVFVEQAQRMLDAMQQKYNTTTFTALHARIEQDFRWACEGADWRSWRQTLRMKCILEDDDMLTALKDRNQVPQGTLLYVASGEADVVKLLPNLCKYYRCFVKGDVTVELSPKISSELSSMAFLEFVFVSLQAGSFYGNAYSSFSLELLNDFKGVGKPAAYLNPKET